MGKAEENWIYEASPSQLKTKAQKILEKVKNNEKEKAKKPIRINAKTIIFK
jgi:hypothetical protein